MKPLAVLFATREGHTKKIAEYVAAVLRAQGLEVELHQIVELLDDQLLDRCSGAILAASVHAGRHEKEMVEFVKEQRDRLERIPTAFLSVSLTEAGAEREGVKRGDRKEVGARVTLVIEEFFEETGWRADLVKPVAGALAYSKYGALTRWMMRQIAKKQGGDTDATHDYEYTDWAGIDRFLGTFTSVLGTASKVKAETVSIATFLPQPRLEELDHIDVRAPAEIANSVALHFDLARAPLIRWLFRLRVGGEVGSLRLDQIGAGAGPGFKLLFEEPGAFVVGAIGRFWEKDITFAEFEPDAFAAFDAPGWGKVAWSIRVEPLGAQRSRIHVEVRVTATDDRSWKSFRRYWRKIGPFSRMIRRRALRMMARDLDPHAGLRDVGAAFVGASGMLLSMLTPMLRRRRARWGLAPEIAARKLPGDEHIVRPRWEWTHGIEIDAPPEKVWPWVAQIGQDRAGFYSYQLLENVAGCRIQNAERVHPEWSAPKEGEALWLHPRVPPIPIAEVEPQRWMLAHACGADEVQLTWLFLLEPLDDGRRTRVISRYRIRYPKRLSLRLGPALIEPIGFMMDRRMLIGVKERAERC